MANTVKFTEEEISKINKLRSTFNNVVQQLGHLQLQRKKLLDEITNEESKLYDVISDLSDDENKLFKQLSDKYGDGEYNPTTGEFTPTDNQ